MAKERWVHISEVAIEAERYIKGRADGSIRSLKTGWRSMDEASLNGLEIPTILLFGGLSGVKEILTTYSFINIFYVYL